jgi:uncharacterized membrane protein
MATGKPRRARRLPYVLRIINAHRRLAIGNVLGIAVWAALRGWGGWEATRQILVAWDAGVALYLMLTYRLMARSGVEHIPAHAADADEGRLALLVLTVLAAMASLGAILAELGASPGAPRTPVQLTLAGITIVLSWVFIHTIFALNYAHDYYGEHGGKTSGLDFPGEEQPDYGDSSISPSSSA